VSVKKSEIVAAPPANAPVTPAPRIVPRLLRITDAADYLSCTYGFVETLMREKTIPVVVLGKRHLLDRENLDELIEQLKSKQNGA
jgi:excisionase family DNA binding protein